MSNFMLKCRAIVSQEFRAPDQRNVEASPDGMSLEGRYRFITIKSNFLLAFYRFDTRYRARNRERKSMRATEKKDKEGARRRQTWNIRALQAWCVHRCEAIGAVISM